jgi:glucokinase
MNYIGIEIGGSKLQIVLADEHVQVIERFKFVVDPKAGAEGIRKYIADTLIKLKSVKLEAIGVGFGGPVNRISGNIWTSYHISGWSDFNIVDWLQQLSGAAVFIDNDGNVAALGESLHGAGKRFNSILYVTLGSGVGGGLVLDKKIYRGALPGEVEIGHIRLDKNGRTLQSSCSGWAVDEKIRKAVAKNPKDKLAQLTKEFKGAEAKILLQAMNEGDTEAIHIFEDTIDDLVLGLSHAVHLFHPETIILGGGLSLIGEPLRNMVEQKLPFYLMDAFTPGPVIQLSALKEDAVPLGAVSLAIVNSNRLIS